MHESALSAWESFYVIVGSSGGALIGLQFVVITLIADRHVYTRGDSLTAFGTPTVVHFAGALLISAIMSAPWPSLAATSIAVLVSGIAGLIYGAVTIVRARRQTEYQPVLEDWLFHAVLPSTSYGALAVSGWLMRSNPALALFVIAASALALLVIGIHNAWDTVTHIVITSSQREAEADAVRRAEREEPSR